MTQVAPYISNLIGLFQYGDQPNLIGLESKKFAVFEEIIKPNRNICKPGIFVKHLGPTPDRDFLIRN